MEILDVETEDRNGLVHVALKGELDLSTVAKVQDELRRVEEGEPPVERLDVARGRGRIHGSPNHGRPSACKDDSRAGGSCTRASAIIPLVPPIVATATSARS